MIQNILSRCNRQNVVAAPLSSLSATKVRTLIDNVTVNPNKAPGCVFATVNSNGKSVFAHASGTRGIESTEPMTLDTVFWMASFTKLITAIAAVQLAEGGKLALDDAEQVEGLCPELKHMKILKGFDRMDNPFMVESKNKITVRQCLSHTGKWKDMTLSNLHYFHAGW